MQTMQVMPETGGIPVWNFHDKAWRMGLDVIPGNEILDVSPVGDFMMSAGVPSA